MKRRSFVGTVIGSVFAGLAAITSAGRAKERLVIRGLAVWNERERRWDIEPSCLMRVSKDFASFNANVSPDAEKQFARAAGETFEALKDYGIKNAWFPTQGENE